MPTLHIECIDGKCNYSTQKHLEQLAACPKNNTSTMDLYGAKSSEFEQFRNVSIPAMLLHIVPRTQDNGEPLYETEENESGNMLDEEKFISLLRAVQDKQVAKKLRITKKKEKKEKTKKEKTHKTK